MKWKYAKFAWLAPLAGAVAYVGMLLISPVHINEAIIIFSLTAGVGVIFGAVLTVKCFKLKDTYTNTWINGWIGMIIILIIAGYILFFLQMISSLSSIG